MGLLLLSQAVGIFRILHVRERAARATISLRLELLFLRAVCLLLLSQAVGVSRMVHLRERACFFFFVAYVLRDSLCSVPVTYGSCERVGKRVGRSRRRELLLC